jgi:hypothetical protein
MDILEIEILDPKARKYLKKLVDQNLITIRSDQSDFQKWLNEMRTRTQKAPTPEEIQGEVEEVRKKRCGR